MLLKEFSNVLVGGTKGLPPTLAFLFRLAWSSRIRLPVIIAVAFMVTNMHLRLEINVNIDVQDDNQDR